MITNPYGFVDVLACALLAGTLIAYTDKAIQDVDTVKLEPNLVKEVRVLGLLLVLFLNIAALTWLHMSVIPVNP